MVMRSKVLTNATRKMIRHVGETVTVGDLKKIVGKSRRPQGIMWEIKQKGLPVQIVRAVLKNGKKSRRAQGYMLKRVPKAYQDLVEAPAKKAKAKKVAHKPAPKKVAASEPAAASA